MFKEMTNKEMMTVDGGYYTFAEFQRDNGNPLSSATISKIKKAMSFTYHFCGIGDLVNKLEAIDADWNN
jgi:bacteriocin-like protein